MKSLWKICVATTPEAEDAIAEFLGTIFGGGVSAYFDVETQISIVSVYFSDGKFLSHEVHEDICEGLQRIKSCGLQIGSGRISISKIRREDWAESWKRHFKPIEIGCSLLVKPSWSKKRPRKGQAVVMLDPGLSFGTGQHPTTLFCLREITRCRKIGMYQSFLDIGAGSGILAIAAAKLGYAPVCAIDFDNEAVRVARTNARANGVLGKIKIVRGDVAKLPKEPKQRFDLVSANLISDLLIAERRKIAAQLKSSGILVLAGILKPEFSEVQRAFEALGLKLIIAKSEGGWCSGSFCFS